MIKREMPFNPNEGIGGFNKGGYDDNAIYPTTVNWTCQSSFLGPNKPIISWEAVIKNVCGKSHFVISSDGVLYFGGDDGNLYAVQPDGTYRSVFKSNYALGTPVIGRNGIIYIGASARESSKVHKLFAITPKYELKWELELSYPIIFPPVIDENGMIYIITRQTTLHAITPDGEFKWSFSKKFEYWSAPILAYDGTIYLGAGDKNLYCVSNSGVEKWSKFVGHGGSVNDPKIGDDGTLYVCVYCNNKRIIKAINSDESIRWEFILKEGDIWTAPSLSNNGALYIGASQFKIISLGTDGVFRWETKIDGFIISSPLIDADGVIYAATYNSIGNAQISKIFAINPDGTEKWVYEFKNGRINWLSLGGNGIIYALINDSKKNEMRVYALSNEI